jgi:hypothetical protein
LHSGSDAGPGDDDTASATASATTAGACSSLRTAPGLLLLRLLSWTAPALAAAFVGGPAGRIGRCAGN